MRAWTNSGDSTYGIYRDMQRGDSMEKMSRVWGGPSADTFSIKPIGDLLDYWLADCAVVVDPFARASRRGTITNDLNPEMPTDYHMDAADFCAELLRVGTVADAVLFDPPYSPRQIAEVYQGIGRTPTMEDTQNARLYKRVRNGLHRILRVGGLAVSFGWNSVGFGETRGYETAEILLVTHGAAHNDTIALVERKVREQGELAFDAEVA